MRYSSRYNSRFHSRKALKRKVKTYNSLDLRIGVRIPASQPLKVKKQKVRRGLRFQRNP